jgi:membrane fusion protein (multidrug efflux system)
VNQARREYERFRELGRRGFAPQARIDDLRANLEDAQASLSAVQARRQDRVIRAPFSGVIGLTDAAPGMLVSPGTPIATLDDLAVIHVDFDIPERFLSVVREGVAIQATADALPGATLQGRIARLDTRVDPQTRAITARAELPNPGGRIRPGMLLRVLVREGARTGLAVPEGALQAEGDTTYIFAVADQGGRTVAQRRTVLTGAREGGFVELREGAQAGERVVAEGLNRVRPNQPIRIAGAGAAGGAPPAGRRAAP